MIRGTTFAAFLALTVLAITQPVPGVQIYHHDSGAANVGYHEVFLVTRAPPGITKADLTVTVDEVAQDVKWTGGPELAAGDTFAFNLTSFDQARHLEIHDGKHTLATLRFGGGAGTPVPP